MTKNAERRDRFRKIGAAISAFKKTGDPNVPDYHTGHESSFTMKRFDAKNRENARVEIPYGPQYKTPQWDRTTSNE